STGSSGRSARWASSKEGPNQTFALTAIGEHLRTDSQISIAGWARLIGQEYFWNTWGRLLVGIECGKNVFHQLHGEDVWTWRARDPQLSRAFDDAMTSRSMISSRQVIAAYDFCRFALIVDIGGGRGRCLGDILAATPSAG